MYYIFINNKWESIPSCHESCWNLKLKYYCNESNQIIIKNQILHKLLDYVQRVYNKLLKKTNKKQIAKCIVFKINKLKSTKSQNSQPTLKKISRLKIQTLNSQRSWNGEIQLGGKGHTGGHL